MARWLQELDRLLQGEATRPEELRGGKLGIGVQVLLMLCLLLGVIAGFFTAWPAVFNRGDPQFLQVLAAMLKVPALFLLTLAVTFPSLYVFSALLGSRLPVATLLRLLLAGIAVALAVSASFGTILGFFALTTRSYGFMVLLNVACYAIGGALGLGFLLQTLQRLVTQWRTEAVAAQAGEESRGPLRGRAGQTYDQQVRLLFQIWVVVFALVGAQMSWVLRPFIGNPSQPFAWFRPRDSHFFEAVWHTLRALFG